MRVFSIRIPADDRADSTLGRSRTTSSVITFKAVAEGLRIGHEREGGEEFERVANPVAEDFGYLPLHHPLIFCGVSSVMILPLSMRATREHRSASSR